MTSSSRFVKRNARQPAKLDPACLGRGAAQRPLRTGADDLQRRLRRQRIGNRFTDLVFVNRRQNGIHMPIPCA